MLVIIKPDWRGHNRTSLQIALQSLSVKQFSVIFAPQFRTKNVSTLLMFYWKKRVLLLKRDPDPFAPRSISPIHCKISFIAKIIVLLTRRQLESSFRLNFTIFYFLSRSYYLIQQYCVVSECPLSLLVSTAHVIQHQISVQKNQVRIF